MKPYLLAGKFLASLCLIMPLAHAVDGAFDTTWGNAGRLLVDATAGNLNTQSVFLIQPDGKLVMAGVCNNHSFCVTRQLPNGSYDTSFGPSSHPGRAVTTAFANFVILNAAVLTADGSIVLVGSYNTGTGLLVKFMANGNSYSSRDGSPPFFGPVTYDGYFRINAIAIQADGQIVVAAQVSGAPLSNSDVVILRGASDGSSIDSTFGDSGVKRVVFPGGNASPKALTIQSDGKIIVAGYANNNAAIARVLINGQFDDDPATGFGNNGIAVFDWGAPSSINAIKVDRDGSILVAGSAYGGTGPKPNFDFIVDRLTKRGMQDSNFGLACPPPTCAAAPAYIDIGANTDDFAYSLAVQPDGKILVGGTTDGTTGAQSAVVNRLSAYGDADDSFGTGGQSIACYGATCSSDVATGIAVGNGGIMIAGTGEASDGSLQFGIAKLQLDLIFKSGFE